MPSPHVEIDCYLGTGEHDMLFADWPGYSLVERARFGSAELRGALIAEVKRRTAHATVPDALARIDTEAFTRAKVAPMVRGLFATIEQPPVLDLLARSVVFLTPATIVAVIEHEPYLRTAWRLANIYLLSCGAKPLAADDDGQIVGLSVATTCTVSMAYFTPSSPFDDFVVHEAAHVFHNCKRVTVGLPATRRHEWLLDIAFGKRETFAYACETYSRIIELGDNPTARRRLLSEVEDGPMPPDERVDAAEFIDILRQAVAAHNGWKRILDACAPPRQMGTA